MSVIVKLFEMVVQVLCVIGIGVFLRFGWDYGGFILRVLSSFFKNLFRKR